MFAAAADLASAVITRRELVERWTEPSALTGYTIGGLTAHLLLATERTETILDEPEPEGPDAVVVGLPAFYGVNRAAHPGRVEDGLHALIRETAERQARDGAEAVVARFRGVVDRLSRRLPDERPERLVTVLQVPNGATRLDTYLRTRVVELVVHADDIAVSIGVDLPPVPEDAAQMVVESFTEMARERAGDLGVIRAFARSERAPTDVLRAL